ncbi:hypothetical protein yc1106_09437 [Curvularia clavata]|uniref:Uncharacterized protein n=1 Tax=Curvularia clavata TaxID=95742 RepID=A0A9Q9DVH1_CURCL|nr:hypothetical protein yc1106_09437 [Curvularia clavata]
MLHGDSIRVRASQQVSARTAYQDPIEGRVRSDEDPPLECRISLLKKECRNCYRNGVKVCVLVEVPVPNFEKLDQELARLEQQESEADAAEAAALQSLVAARAKKDRLHCTGDGVY